MSMGFGYTRVLQKDGPQMCSQVCWARPLSISTWASKTFSFAPKLRNILWPYYHSETLTLVSVLQRVCYYQMISLVEAKVGRLTR